MDQRRRSQNFSSHNKQEKRAFFHLLTAVGAILLPLKSMRPFPLSFPNLTLKTAEVESNRKNLLESMEFLLLVLWILPQGPEWTGCRYYISGDSKCWALLLLPLNNKIQFVGNKETDFLLLFLCSCEPSDSAFRGIWGCSELFKFKTHW